jgi:uncharacterized protein
MALSATPRQAAAWCFDGKRVLMACPVCKQPAVPEHKPFCSRGCKDRDLLKWLDGKYAVAGSREEDSGRLAGGDEDDA